MTRKNGVPVLNGRHAVASEYLNDTTNNTYRQHVPASESHCSGRYAIVPFAVSTSAAFKSLSAGHLKVYIALASHANAERVCWPKVETLAETAGVTDRTVHAAIKQLVELGLLVVSIGGGRKNTNRYQLLDQPVAVTEKPEEGCGVSGSENPEAGNGVSPLNPETPAHKPRSTFRGNIREQTCLHGDEESPRVLGLRSALSEAGIRGPNLDRLAGLDDLTIEDVDALAAIAQDNATHSPAGLLVRMITAGQRPVSRPGSTPNVTNDFTRPSSRKEAAHLFPSIPN